LEEYTIENKLEFATLKQNQTEQKALSLELDRSSREKIDKLFERVLTSQENMSISQGKTLTKLLNNQNADSKGRVELTKTKLAMYGGIIAAAATLLEIILNKIL